MNGALGWRGLLLVTRGFLSRIKCWLPGRQRLHSQPPPLEPFFHTFHPERLRWPERGQIWLFRVRKNPHTAVTRPAPDACRGGVQAVSRALTGHWPVLMLGYRTSVPEPTNEERSADLRQLPQFRGSVLWSPIIW